MKTIFDILTDTDRCTDIIRQVRWNGEVRCPYCGTGNVRVRKSRFDGIRYYQCNVCSKGFSDISGTVMERTHLPVSMWLLAAQLMNYNLSDRRLSIELGVEENTASRIARLIRTSTFFRYALHDAAFSRGSR